MQVLNMARGRKGERRPAAVIGNARGFVLKRFWQ
jgi:hypothetical protein